MGRNYRKLKLDMKFFLLVFFLLLDHLMKQDSKSLLKITSRDHKKLLRSRGGEMELVVGDDLRELPNEKLKVVVELEQDNLRISCEGPCDVNKWRSAYVRYWRRKMKKEQWKEVL